jgi:hypothetical protein
LFGGKIVQLLTGEREMFGTRHHKHVFFWADGQVSVEGGLYQRLARAEGIQKLFRLGVAAVRPKAHANSACHEYYVEVFVHWGLLIF